MGKKVHDDVLDAALNEIINNADTLVACDGEPASYSDATTLKSNGGHKLGDVSVSGELTGPTDGDTSGRKLTVPQKDVSIDEGGTVDHVALVDDGGSRLLHVSTLSSNESVAGGDTLPLDSYDEEIEDPV